VAVLLGALAVAGCGGSKSTSTSLTTTTATTFPPLTTTGPATVTETTVTLTKTTTTTTKNTARSPTGAINVRVPARFTIAADGSVNPPTITIPAHLPVELIVIGNAQPHRIALRATTFAVGAHQQAEKLVDGLKTGSYPLEVDGVRKAVLTIGGEPGP
jgi:hypothetical protein